MVAPTLRLPFVSPLYTMETGRASRFPNCLKFRKAKASSFLLITYWLEIHATHSKAWGVSITIRACPSAQDNEPSVPRADTPLSPAPKPI